MSAYDNQSELLRHETLTLHERLLRERLGEVRSAISTRNYYRIGEDDKEVVRRDSIEKSLEESQQVSVAEIVPVSTESEAIAPAKVTDSKTMEQDAYRMLAEAFGEAA